MNTAFSLQESCDSTTSVYSVHLVMKTEADVFTLCHAIKTILTNEHTAHTVSRPPIFCASRIQMARDLLLAAYNNNPAHEVVHVLPGSHNMFFKLHLQSDDENIGAVYRVLFCYRDKRPLRPDHANNIVEMSDVNAHENSGVAKKRRRRKRSYSTASDSSNGNNSDSTAPKKTHSSKKRTVS